MKKLLLVDDEQDILLELREVLEDEGYSALTAESVDLALIECKKHDDISLIITDLKMPDKDGYTLIDEIKAVNPCIKFILMSGHYDESIDNKPNQGFLFIKKPLDIDKLLLMIRGYLAYN